ncbi:MAG TPA: RidA family protein [Afifellaceae bacterium]|jgi:enamine deaminase RidA (YjgF/YER057c/UK114 family)|nr:RidA family protein [Afifellaceae bacterium]
MLDIKRYNYAEWTQGRFSEAVTVTGPGKTIYLAGIGAEHEVHGAIQHPDDFAAQCRYAYAKLKAVLERNGASMADVVKQTTYVTDVRFQPTAGKCRSEAYEGLQLPAHTFLTVSQLAWPHMLVEFDIIAVAPLPDA